MRKVQVSIYSVAKLATEQNIDVFEAIPENDSILNQCYGETFRHDLIDSILESTADMTTLYTNPLHLKGQISVWWVKNKYTIYKLAKTLNLEYNPIFNKDGTKTETVTQHHTVENSGNSQTTTENASTVESNDENELKTSAFNSNAYEPKEKTTGNGTSINSGSASGTTENENVEEKNATETRTIHESGNIGVTTTQEMIEAERTISMFNFIDVLARLFIQDFCIALW